MRIDSPPLARICLPLFALGMVAAPLPGQAQSPVAATVAGPTYADLVGLVEASTVIARVQVKDQVAVEPERAPGLAPGKVRLYVTGQTSAALKAPAAIGESLKGFEADNWYGVVTVAKTKRSPVM